MKITCTKCQKKLIIPDDKLPDKDVFKVTCPMCGEKVSVDRNTFEEKSSLDMISESGANFVKSELPKNLDSNTQSNSSEADEFEEGARPALVCESDFEIQRQIVKALSELGYSSVTPKNMDEAFEKIRFTRFKVVVLNELFDSSKDVQNDLLDHFVRMPMIDRRHVFLALTGNDFKSMDNGTAFSKSVNVVINLSDVQKFGNFIKKAIAENDQFYRVYKGILKELGKA